MVLLFFSRALPVLCPLPPPPQPIAVMASKRTAPIVRIPFAHGFVFDVLMSQSPESPYKFSQANARNVPQKLFSIQLLQLNCRLSQETAGIFYVHPMVCMVKTPWAIMVSVLHREEDYPSFIAKKGAWLDVNMGGFLLSISETALCFLNSSWRNFRTSPLCHPPGCVNPE